MRPRNIPAQFDPDLALRPGNADARVVLYVWLYRTSWLPVLWVGLIMMQVAGAGDGIGTVDFTDAGTVMRELVSPLSGVIIALAIRVTSGWVALAFAYPMTRWTVPSQYGDRSGESSGTRMWLDRIRLTGAYRAMRSSWLVRSAAAERLGAEGRRLMLAASLLVWSNVALVAAWILVLLV
jgi:hypothetical protein